MRDHKTRVLVFWLFVLIVVVALFIAIDLALVLLAALIGFIIGVEYQKDFGDE